VGKRREGVQVLTKQGEGIPAFLLSHSSEPRANAALDGHLASCPTKAWTISACVERLWTSRRAEPTSSLSNTAIGQDGQLKSLSFTPLILPTFIVCAPLTTFLPPPFSPRSRSSLDPRSPLHFLHFQLLPFPYFTHSPHHTYIDTFPSASSSPTLLI